jgi:ParB family chromosome partitioning protein
MLELDADITDIHGAEYNPRKITEEDLAALRESITRLGIVKPIIVRGKTIVAGHQRTKSLRAIGVTRAPVYWLQTDTTTYDEVRFNQLHNGTDLDIGDEAIRITKPLSLGFNEIARDEIEGQLNGPGAIIRKAICELIAKYGPWGACVATLSGEVIHASQYAIAAAVSGVPVTVYAVADEQKDFAQKMLSRVYGRFSYDAVERHTYVQSLAQPNRRIEESGLAKLSRLYRYKVEPHLSKNQRHRLLDFGAGRGNCARRMRDDGYSVRDLEFFRRTDKNEINKSAVHRMVSQLLHDTKTNGLFDAVVCQAVLNSVDSIEAQDAVVGCCNLFCKPGGTLIINGRSLEQYTASLRARSTDLRTRRPEFLDADGFSAIYREGKWFFQKYYSIEDARALIERFGFEVIECECNPPAISNYWVIVAKKKHDLSKDDYRKYVEFEFELPWPDGSTVGMSEKVKQAFDL